MTRATAQTSEWNHIEAESNRDAKLYEWYFVMGFTLHDGFRPDYCLLSTRHSTLVYSRLWKMNQLQWMPLTFRMWPLKIWIGSRGRNLLMRRQNRTSNRRPDDTLDQLWPPKCSWSNCQLPASQLWRSMQVLCLKKYNPCCISVELVNGCAAWWSASTLRSKLNTCQNWQINCTRVMICSRHVTPAIYISVI